MKVKDLIEQLKELDADLPVYTYNHCDMFGELKEVVSIKGQVGIDDDGDEIIKTYIDLRS